MSRLVHVSSVHAIPEPPQGQVIREVDAFDPELVVGGYAKAKAEATQAVLEAAEVGLDAVVVHPSGILGPYDNGSNHLVHMVKTFLTGKLPGVVRGGYDFVDVRDVAKGCLLAAQSGKKGRCYILSGRFSEIRELLALAGRQIGRRVPPLMPQPLAKAVASTSCQPITWLLSKRATSCHVLAKLWITMMLTLKPASSKPATSTSSPVHPTLATSK